MKRYVVLTKSRRTVITASRFTTSDWIVFYDGKLQLAAFPASQVAAVFIEQKAL